MTCTEERPGACEGCGSLDATLDVSPRDVDRWGFDPSLPYVSLCEDCRVAQRCVVLAEFEHRDDEIGVSH